MNWLAILAYAIAMVLYVRFFNSVYEAMIFNTDGPSKSFYYGIQIDVFLLWIIGAAVAQFYLFIFWCSHFIVKTFSTNKMQSRKNLFRILRFIFFSLILQLLIISGTNIITQTYFRVEVLNVFFINHGILTMGLFLIYPLFTMMKYGVMWPKLKMDLMVCIVFSLLSLVAFGVFQLLLIFKVSNQIAISGILLFSLLMIYTESKQLKIELVAYKMEEPVNEYSVSDPKMQQLTNLIDESDFRDLRKISKKRVMQQQDSIGDSFEIPKECPYCKNPLSRDAFCEVCGSKICPKCYSKVSAKVQQCTCGFLFKIPIQKIHQDEKIQEFKSENMINDEKNKDSNKESEDVESKEGNIQIEGNIPRICPYCGAIGWKEDICRCGYDYIRKIYLPKR
jgi:hypothetical protein